jgi:hypothetical protein
MISGERDMCGQRLTKHGRPSLVNDVQAYTSASANQPSPGSRVNSLHLIDIRMEDLVHESNTR